MKDSRSPRSFLADHLTSVPRSGIRDFFDIVSSRKDIISLGVGEPDFATPWHIREASIYALERGVTSYTENLGLPQLREDLSSYVEDFFKVSYDPKTEILVTVGVSEAMDLALRAILNPGDEVIYHEPCYVSYAPTILFAHGVPVPVTTSSENDFRITREMIEPKVTDRTRAIVLNFPTNPTGASMSRENLQEIANLAIERDLLVISDEIYAELTYDSVHDSIAAIPGMKERTIFLHGFSKSWAMTGFRLAYSCAPPELTEGMMKIHQYTMLCAPILSQKAAIEALKNPGADIEPMKQAYDKRRNLMYSRFNEMGLPCHKPKGAFYAFPSIQSTGLSAKDFAQRLLDEKDVACVPGTAFGESGEGFVRCAYATGLDDIKEALDRIEDFIKNL